MKYKIASCTTESYCLEYKVYYKRGFFCNWKQFGKYDGYLTLEECIKVIEEFKETDKRVREINKGML